MVLLAHLEKDGMSLSWIGQNVLDRPNSRCERANAHLQLIDPARHIRPLHACLVW
jgi:hypothetical protein